MFAPKGIKDALTGLLEEVKKTNELLNDLRFSSLLEETQETNRLLQLISDQTQRILGLLDEQ